MAKLVNALRRAAFRKGVLGTSRGWFALWAGIGLTRFVRSRLGKEPVLVERVVLRRGQGVVITDTGIERQALEG